MGLDRKQSSCCELGLCASVPPPLIRESLPGGLPFVRCARAPRHRLELCILQMVADTPPLPGPKNPAGAQVYEQLPPHLRPSRSQPATVALRRVRPDKRSKFPIHSLCNNYPRHLWIEPANAVCADDKICRIENMAFDKVQHSAVDLWSLRLH
jgi:hypothetical protein